MRTSPLAFVLLLAPTACAHAATPVPPTTSGPVATLGTTKPDVAALDPEKRTGCFAWSARESRALCIRTDDSIQQGGSTELEMIPGDETVFPTMSLASYGAQDFTPHPATLTPAQRQLIAAEVARGDYVAIDTDGAPWMQTLAPDSKVALSPAVTVSWKRKASLAGDPATGRWKNFGDGISVTCGKHAIEWFTEEHADPAPVVHVGIVPGGHALLLDWSDHWTVEGDGGGTLHAMVFDLARCTAPTPPKPTPDH